MGRDGMLNWGCYAQRTEIYAVAAFREPVPVKYLQCFAKPNDRILRSPQLSYIFFIHSFLFNFYFVLKFTL
jgi:hypothetical protein